MSDYRSDQYYNLTRAGEDSIVTGTGVGRLSDLGNVNKRFSFPDRTIRTIDQSGERTDHVLQRGYIRSLIDESQGYEVPINRCRFQFNPSTLNQHVAANTGMLNVLQQDPAQWAQPLASDVSFNFQLIFDRTYELNSPNGGNSIVEDLETASLWEQLPPEQIGVLHDVGLLFSVIGVGISESQKQYVTSLLESRAIIEAASDADVLAGDADVETVASGAKSNVPTLLEYNAGNTGFLIPLPVRAVFSSLYVVEGLARTVSVIFTKFNRAMVPMRCTVDLHIEAKYIGFAKKKTFFTSSLEKVKETAREYWIEKQKTNEDVHKAAKNVLNKIIVKTVKGINTNRDFDDSTYEIEDFLTPVVDDTGYVTTMASLPAAWRWRNAKDNTDPISDFFDQGSEVSISVVLSKTIYRYSVDFAELEEFFYGDGGVEVKALKGRTGSDLVSAFSGTKDPKVAVTNGTDSFLTPIYHCNSIINPQYGAFSSDDAVNAVATTKDEWHAMIRYIAAPPGRVWNSNGSSSFYLNNDPVFEDYEPDDYYYAIEYEGTITLSVDGYTVTGRIKPSRNGGENWRFGHIDRYGRNAGLGADMSTGLELPVYWEEFEMEEVPPEWQDDIDEGSLTSGSYSAEIIAGLPDDFIYGDPGLLALLPD